MPPQHKQTTDNRALAKWGMAISMGSLLVSGLMEHKKGSTGQNLRNVHLWSGMALTGFALWHHSLYQPKR